MIYDMCHDRCISWFQEYRSIPVHWHEPTLACHQHLVTLTLQTVDSKLWCALIDTTDCDICCRFWRCLRCGIPPTTVRLYSWWSPLLPPHSSIPPSLSELSSPLPWSLRFQEPKFSPPPNLWLSQVPRLITLRYTIVCMRAVPFGDEISTCLPQ